MPYKNLNSFISIFLPFALCVFLCPTILVGTSLELLSDDKIILIFSILVYVFFVRCSAAIAKAFIFFLFS
jgi:hypothetical protein